MIIEIGKTYGVAHDRKGRFVIKITAIGRSSVTGTIVTGKATSSEEHNDRYIGDQITMKKSMCKFSKVEPDGKNG
jgi:hypothetical protein